MKRRYLLILIPLAACDAQGPLIPQPLMSPAQAADNLDRRGEVEVYVKSNHPAIINDIAAGGGATLTKAFDLAKVPEEDRPARLIQLRSDIGAYRTSPGALVTVLMIYAR